MQVGTDAHGALPTWAKMAASIQEQLLLERERWRQRLLRNPACFGEAEVGVHATFQELADQVVAGLLAEVGASEALENAGKKSC